MKQGITTLAAALLLAGGAAHYAQAQADAALKGTVRDTHGVPQGGALVELLGPEAHVIARVATDSQGRYSFAHLLPGTYRVRASAAFLLPSVGSSLHLHAGAQALADLSMALLFDAGSWLPVDERAATGHGDDWRWALRSAANRPMLRLVESTGGGPSDSYSSSAEHSRTLLTTGEVAVLAGDGRFGDGGTHQVLSVGRAEPGGDLSLLTANVGAGGSSLGATGSLEVAGVLEHNLAGGGQTRMYLSVASHPELQTGAGSEFGLLEFGGTERFTLGDAVLIDAGTLLTAERLSGTRFESAPYLRVAVQPTADLAIEYRVATNRTLQASSDLDEARPSTQVLADDQGRPLLRKSLHQELTLAHTTEKTHLTLGVFHDRIPVEGIAGGGPIGVDQMRGLPIIADSATGTLRIATPGTSGFGVRACWTETMSPVWSATVEADLGDALLANAGLPLQAASLAAAVQPHATYAVRGNVRMKARRTGTVTSVHYRWQEQNTLTQVDEFDAEPADAGLGIEVRQRVWTGRHVRGLNAVVEASNLLAQGYEPFLGPDGQTLFLAQVPRSLQAGLAFSF